MIIRLFDISTKDHGECHTHLPPGVTLGELFDGDDKLKRVADNVTRVTVNGLERKEWRKASPGKNDRINIELLPGDPATLGILTQIFQIISAVATVARFIISLFQQPQKPKGASADKSQTYTFEGIRDNFPPGDPVPVVWGTQRKGGQVLMYQVTMDTDKKHQRMKMLLGLCEGPITSVSAIEINNLGFNNFSSLSYSVAMGTSSQGPIDGFNEIANTFYDGREITNYNTNRAGSHTAITIRTANNNVTDVELQVRAPAGLYTIGKRKGTIYPQWSRYVVEIKRSFHNYWTLVATRTLRAPGGLAAQRPIWDVFKFSMPEPDEYDVRLTWIKSSADPMANHPVGFEYRLELFNYTEFTGTMPVYSSTALLAIQGVATQELQGGQPTVTAIIHGREVKRFYTADSFDVGWSNNPAWAIRDYLTNSIFGMGAYISEADLHMQSFLDFATLANSDIDFCAPSAPNPQDMRFGDIYCDKNAVTAFQGDPLQNTTIGVNGTSPQNVFQLVSREDGKPRYGICYVHMCCPPFPKDGLFGPYGCNSPDDFCNFHDSWMQFMGTVGPGAISGLVSYVRSGTMVHCGTAYGMLYDDTVDSPYLMLMRWNSSDMSSLGVLLGSKSVVLTPGAYIEMQIDGQRGFDSASGYTQTQLWGYTCDSAFSNCVTIFSGVTESNTSAPQRIPSNPDGLLGTLSLPSYKDTPVLCSHQWGNYQNYCGTCYNTALKLDYTCNDRDFTSRALKIP